MLFMEFLLNKSKIFGLLTIVLIMVSIVSGKSRWQLYPLYLLGAIYFILVLFNYFKVLALSPLFTKWIIGTGFFLIGISIILLLVFPKEKLPLPSGSFQVGTRFFELEDSSRNEVYSNNKNDKRKLKYGVWYPADKIKGYKKSKWIQDGLALTRQLASSMHMLPFMLDHTAEISSNSYLGPPISKSADKYPLVIISHGWKGFRELHTDFAEELASNGFIAVSIDHTYGSQAVKFEDESLAYLNEDALSSIGNPSKYASDSNILVTTYGEDVASVLDDLERLNKNNPDFKSKLDLDAIGVVGHSTGGGGDVFISIKDKRIKALLGLDAWVNPIPADILKEGLQINSLFLRSEQWSKGPNNIALDILLNNSKNANLIEMNKTNHVDFTMAYMYSPLSKYVGFTGELGGRKSSEIQREIILSFFDKNLRNNGHDKYLDEIIDKYENLNLQR